MHIWSDDAIGLLCMGLLKSLHTRYDVKYEQMVNIS